MHLAIVSILEGLPVIDPLELKLTRATHERAVVCDKHQVCEYNIVMHTEMVRHVLFPFDKINEKRLTARRRVIASDIGERTDDGQLCRAALFVLLVKMTMTPEQDFANLNTNTADRIACFACDPSIILLPDRAS